ncbi:uncharacterized protein LOC121406413 [Lytechinus variegatus]|uniref:uncharacterized protein LOC121406413 n=1 Tax=Lytechinus variegatus TaxID=7654 RepID=UPI001BB2A6AA|nr:uncharacterized protein LOC121406413 [Lytechinus variegatus]
MAGLTILVFLSVVFISLSDCQEGSGDGSGTESIFTDVTGNATDVLTDGHSDPSDIQAFGLVITNDFTEFTLDVDNIITYNVTIKNAGGTDITASGSDLYDLLLKVSDNSNPLARGATTQDITPLLTSATNINVGIAAGETIVIENVHTMINVSSHMCSTYQGGYVCVEISKALGASYTDVSATNNCYCLTFGDVRQGYTGMLRCSAFVGRISLIALVISMLLAYFAYL